MINKIEPLIEKLEKLEKDILEEEKNLVLNLQRVLKKKFEEDDTKTIEIQKKLIAKQEYDFKSFKLNRSNAVKKLNVILPKLIGRKFDLSDSEHWPLFSAISEQKKNGLRILEIGTHNGLNSVLLANLFPTSKITTIDLPQEEKKFQDSYGRKDAVLSIVKKRDELIDKFSNIEFLAINSVKLSGWPEKYFDVIWVDGAHGYPVLPLDLLNSCRIIKAGGIVVIDDVFINLRKSDEMYRSLAAIETMNLFKENEIIKDYKLIRKRLDLRYNIKNLNEKFLGFIEF